MNRPLARFFAALFVPPAVLGSLLGLLLQLSLPREAGVLQLEGLAAPVRILRDRNGVPHIHAASEEDAYFAVGFLHAQDRLWQMEWGRRVAAGRLAEILGPGALAVDRFMRTLGLARRAARNLPRLGYRTRLLLAAYAAGVNAAMRTQLIPPPEFLLLGFAPEPWRAEDSLALARLMALELESDFRAELLRAGILEALGPEALAELFPGTQAAERAEQALPMREMAPLLRALAQVVPPAGRTAASNAWAVSGARSRSGLPVLAGDPHLPLRIPGPWYVVAIASPELSVAGATLPGLPPVVIGRSRRIAWTFTAAHADTQDLFIERLLPGERYLAPEGPRRLRVRGEWIHIRGGGAELLRVRESRHGPLLSDLAGIAAPAGARALALSWPALREDDRTLEAVFALARADSVEAFARALLRFDAPVQNVIYASRDGHIGLRVVGRVPRRRGPDGTLPRIGWSGSEDWDGFVPRDELPAIIDPPSGTVVNANDRVGEGEASRRVAVTFPPPLRARRIAALLDARPRHDAASFARIQLDRRSALAARLRDWLLAAEPRTGDAAALLAAMADWDLEAGPDRPEPLFFIAWYEALLVALLEDDLGSWLAAYRPQAFHLLERVRAGAVQWCDDRRTRRLESCAEIATRAFEAAWRHLVAVLGPDWRRWRWGAVHRARFVHEPLSRAPPLAFLFGLEVPVGGDPSTVNVAHHRGRVDFTVVHAATLRMIVDWGAPAELLFTVATGPSGHPLSPSYRDITRIWAAGGYLPLVLDGGAQGARRVPLLEPAGR